MRFAPSWRPRIGPRRGVGRARFELLALALGLFALLGFYLSVRAPETARVGEDPAGPEPVDALVLPADEAVEDERPEPRRTRVGAPIGGVDAGAESSTADGPGIRGRVIDESGVAVAGAEVSLWIDPHRAGPFGATTDGRKLSAVTVSDSLGRFALELDAAALADVEASARGFAPGFALNVRAGEDVELVLGAPGVLKGFVFGPDRTPLAGARVRLSPGVLTIPGSVELETRTEFDGRYRFGNLSGGAWTVDVNATGHVALFGQAVTVPSGGELVRDFALDAGAVLHGTVRDAVTGSPIPDAVVALGLDEEERARTGDAGGYRLTGVPAGASVQVTASAKGFGAWERQVWLTAGYETDLDFELLPARRAYGRVVDDGGAPVAEALVRVQWSTRDQYGVSRYDFGETRSALDGSFALEDLRADAWYTLFVSKPGVGSALRDFPRTDAEVIQLGDVRLPRSASIAGALVDPEGRPLGDMWVLLSGDDRDRGLLNDDRVNPLGRTIRNLHARTDARGRYRFDDLPPGVYRVSGGAKGWARRAERELSLLPGDELTGIDLVLDPGLEISGVVVDPEGRPVVGVGVHAYRDEDESQFLTARTYALCDARGEFALRGLQPGTYTLHVSGALDSVLDATSERAGWSRSVYTVDAPATNLELVLEVSDPIRGVVLGPDGEPVPACLVGARKPDGTVEFETWSDAEGRFRLDVPLGVIVDLVAIPAESEGSLALHPSVRGGDGQVDLESWGARARDVAAGARGVLLRLPRRP